MYRKRLDQKDSILARLRAFKESIVVVSAYPDVLSHETESPLDLFEKPEPIERAAGLSSGYSTIFQ